MNKDIENYDEIQKESNERNLKSTKKIRKEIEEAKEDE